MAPFEGYKDWRDFTNKVCRPWVEAEHADDEDAQIKYELEFSKVGDYYLAATLVMADNTVRRLEGDAA
jgi:hypothetical protein